MILAYHGTKMQSAISLLQKKYSKKYLYRSTSKDESLPYSKISKYNDKNNHWALLEAEIDNTNIKKISIDEWGNFYNNEENILGDNNWLLDLWKFQIFITRPNYKIQNPKIVEIV